MNKATRYAIAAALTTTLMGSSAMAADLGGNCCADLEERIAELEATTVRKGNRKVSLTISGFVGHAVFAWNDGTQSDVYIGDLGNLTSRFRFRGEAKINPLVTAGFTYEWAAVTNSVSNAGNQLNFGDDLGASGNVGGNTSCGVSGIASSTVGCATLRDATVWMRHAQLGLVKIGQGSTATDNLVLIDLGGMGVMSTPDVALHNGGFILRSNAGLLASQTGINWTAATRGHESFDTNRRNHVLYETPTLQGFTVQAAVAEDNYWDVALRYAGEFNGVRIAAGIGYQEDSKFNQGFQFLNTAGALCVQNCDVVSSELKGALSILHVPTGLFVTTSAGNRELEGTTGSTTASATYAGPDVRYWHIAGGLTRNFFGIGATVLMMEYGEHKGGLAQSAYLATTATTHCFAASGCDSTVTNWGLGVAQYIDAAALELFATYKNFELETNGFSPNGPNFTLNANSSGVHDISVFFAGAKINF